MIFSIDILCSRDSGPRLTLLFDWHFLSGTTLASNIPMAQHRLCYRTLLSSLFFIKFEPRIFRLHNFSSLLLPLEINKFFSLSPSALFFTFLNNSVEAVFNDILL